MATNTNKPKIKMTELSRTDKSVLMAKALIDGMIDNPDEVLHQNGGKLEIYKGLLRDDQVKSCFQQRRAAIVNSEWYVEPASDSPEDEAVAEWWRELLTAIDFDSLTDKMLHAVHYGWSVAETIPEIIDGKISIKKAKVRDRSRFGFGYDGELYLKRPGFKDELMPEDNFWTVQFGADHDDNPYGEGLAHSLYWPVFFKRNGIKYWMIFLEKFSMPTATAKLNQAQFNDPEQRAIALNIIDAVQADSGIVIPEEFAIELVEASRSGTADYQGLSAAMDRAISKIILSQTMTTDDGSSRSQAEVHMGVRNEVIKSDADIICASFNEQVVKRFTAWNFPNASPPKVWRRTEPKTDLAELAERDNKIAKLGYEPTEEYMAETYGTGWRKKAQQVPPTGGGVPELGAEFAEVSQLTAERVGHRKDQASLAEAAEYLASKYPEIYGDRIEQLLAFLEETDDAETFENHLNAMLEEPVNAKTAEFFERANWVSRLMGLLKGKAKA